MAGQSFVIAGFAEMMGSSGFMMRNYHLGNNTVMLIQFIFSMATIALLVLAAYLTGLFKKSDEAV